MRGGCACASFTVVEHNPLVPLLAALKDLERWIEATGTPSVVVGGVAASLHGRPRATRDVDALVLLNEDRWEEFLASGERFGFQARRLDAIAFARKVRVLLVHHRPSGIDVDITMGLLPFEEEAVARGMPIESVGLALRIATPEDIIIMKAVAHRGRDMADIESILDAHPGLDVERVRRWVKEFAAALGTPEILRDLEALIERRKP